MKLLFPAQAALAAVIASGGLTAGAQTRTADTAATNRIDADSVSAAVDPHSYQIGPEDIVFINTFPVSAAPRAKSPCP
jgi:hypothetical protein